MKKVLLAISSTVIGEELVNELSGLCEPILCTDGDQVLDWLLSVTPDVLVLDTMLSGTDSVKAGIRAQKQNNRCEILALTPVATPAVVWMLEEMGVSDLIKMPCNIEDVVGRVCRLLMKDNTQTAQRQITEILLALGFSPRLESFRIIQQTICLYAQDPLQLVTSQLYCQVAQLCNGTVTQVEKAIRNGVESAMRRCDERLWKLYFGTEKNGMCRRPSNKELLFRIVSCVREEMESGEDGTKLKSNIG